MTDIRQIGPSLQNARSSAGVSQAVIARACGTSQSAIARLENGASNATIATLVRCAAAIGYAIEINLVPLPTPDRVIERYKLDVDRASLRENLQHTVDQRLRSLGEWQQSLTELTRATRARRSQPE
jgi:transcriptional regulator with XRE-family HTH domain